MSIPDISADTGKMTRKPWWSPNPTSKLAELARNPASKVEKSVPRPHHFDHQRNIELALRASSPPYPLNIQQLVYVWLCRFGKRTIVFLLLL
jgi:hypothetical protein